MYSEEYSNDKTLEFGEMTKVEIHFTEMRRQQEKIEELGEQTITKLSKLINQIIRLNNEIDGDISTEGLYQLLESIEDKIQIITSGMNEQINLYSNLNEEITSELKRTVDRMVELLLTEGGSSLVITYVDENGTTNEMTYNEALKESNSVNVSNSRYPDWNNTEVWLNNDYAKCGYIGQCTWFAYGRFVEIYGYDPGFRGHGYQCVDQLLNHHSDEFYASTTPVVGSVFSTEASFRNHVGIVVAVDGNTITIQHGNQNGSSDSYDVAQNDWKEEVMTLDQFYSAMGTGVHFANPYDPVSF